MKNAIEQILQNIKKDKIFDSHFIIRQLIQHHSDAYLDYARNFESSSNKTHIVHMHIGKEIAKFEENNTISRLEKMSWSENIHNEPSECTAWVKN